MKIAMLEMGGRNSLFSVHGLALLLWASMGFTYSSLAQNLRPKVHYLGRPVERGGPSHID